MANVKQKNAHHNHQADDAELVENVEVTIVGLQRDPVQRIDDYLRGTTYPEPERAVTYAQHGMLLYFQYHQLPDVSASGEVSTLVKQCTERREQFAPLRQARLSNVKNMQCQQRNHKQRNAQAAAIECGTQVATAHQHINTDTQRRYQNGSAALGHHQHEQAKQDAEVAHRTREGLTQAFLDPQHHAQTGDGTKRIFLR